MGPPPPRGVACPATRGSSAAPPVCSGSSRRQRADTEGEGIHSILVRCISCSLACWKRPPLAFLASQPRGRFWLAGVSLNKHNLHCWSLARRLARHPNTPYGNNASCMHACIIKQLRCGYHCVCAEAKEFLG
ncbi:hypothetical protein PAHAL_5G370200 [Panicum hallii]|uniref:Uncharacterized protein n=1 Tax=Panicum hallii TaxID=206008 RepID=A0A2S3HUP6_9POAL|nr:hypothetical protein PAHAL_5G370200 [Panicum hallii]